MTEQHQNDLSKLSPSERMIFERLQKKLTTPEKKKLPRGRPTKNYTAEEKQWLINYLNIDKNLPVQKLGRLLNNHIQRPTRVVSQQEQKYGSPVYERDLYRPEIPSLRFGIGCIFDDTAKGKLIARLVVIGTASCSSIYEYPYNADNKATILADIKKMIDAVDYEKYAKFNPFYGVKEHLEVVTKMRVNGVHRANEYPTRIAFALALEFHERGKKAERHSQLLNEFGFVAISLKNRDLPPDEPDFDFLEYFKDCAECFTTNLLTGRYVGVTTLSKKTGKLATALTTYRRKFRLKNWPTDLDKLAEKAVISVATRYEDHLYTRKHHQPLILADLKKILNVAKKIDLSFYCRIILQLSTGLRVVDSSKVNKNHLLSTGQLNYSQIAPGEEDHLVTKMVKKLNPIKLVNPTTSIVTRLILKHFDYSIDKKTLDDFWHKDGTVRASLEDGDIAYERCLRTTFATYMMWAHDSSRAFKPVTVRDVQNRMAHKNTLMLNEVYAVNRPHDYDDRTADEYFGTPQLQVDDKNLSEFENVWDMWLLNDFIETVGIKDVKPLLLKEIKDKDVYQPQVKAI